MDKEGPGRGGSNPGDPHRVVVRARLARGHPPEGAPPERSFSESHLSFDRPVASSLAAFTPLFSAAGFSVADCALSPESSGTKEQDFVAFTVTSGDVPGLDWDTGEGRRSGPAQDGDQFLWLPHRPIYGGHDVPLRCLSLMMEPAFLGRAARESVDPDRLELLSQSRLRDPLVAGIAEALRRQHAAPGGVDRLYGETLAAALAVHALRAYSARRPAVADLGRRGLGERDLRRAVAYIHDNLGDDLSLSDIAAAVGLSPYHFARLFKQSAGQSPHQYVTRQRVERAMGLLRAGGLSIGAVAHLVGFREQAALNRHFKRLTGVTPSQFSRR